jgi:serine/threonine protein phosphatase PrpC
MQEFDVEVGNITDTGRVRPENQDYMGYYETPLGHLFIVCDGMGGEVGGRQASLMGVEAIARTFQVSDSQADVRHALAASIEVANREIFKASQSHPELKGMGTTCSIGVLKGNQAHIAHVGDSRIYLIRDGNALLLTRDHSFVQEMIDEGKISASEAQDHPDRNIITRALGIRPEVEAEVSTIAIHIEENDRLLLCSDGLTNLVGDEEIAQIVSAEDTVQDACTKLVGLANERKGHDNITVQIGHVIQVNEKRPRLPVKYSMAFVAVVFLGVIGLMGYLWWTSMEHVLDERLVRADRALEAEDLSKAYEELRAILDENPEDGEATSRMGLVAKMARKEGEQAYIERDYEVAREKLELAKKVYTDVKNEGNAQLMREQIKKIRNLEKARKQKEKKMFSGVDGAISLYSHVLSIDKENRDAIEGLAEIGERLEVFGKKHEDAGEYHKSKDRYETARDVWKNLSAVSRDYTLGIERTTVSIVRCETKLQDMAASRATRQSGARPGQRSPQIPVVTAPVEEIQETGSDRGENRVTDATLVDTIPQVVRSVQESTLVPVGTTPPASQPLFDTNDSNGSIEHSVTTPSRTELTLPSTEVREPEASTDVIKVELRRAAELNDEQWKTIMGQFRKTFYEVAQTNIVMTPKIDRYGTVTKTNIVYRKIQDETMTGQNQRDAEKVLKTTSGLWRQQPEIIAWELADKEEPNIILIIIGQDFKVMLNF